MEFAKGGYLPYDGGDESPRQTAVNHLKWRTSPAAFSYSSSSYTGSGFSGTWTGLSDVESLQSYNHPVSYLGRSQRNIGGKFVHTRLHVDKFGDTLSPYQDGTTWRKATGVYAPSGSFYSDFATSPTDYTSAQSVVSSIVGLSSSSELDAAGTTAIARVSPTNPLVDLSSSAAELLREGLPQRPGSDGNPGSEYLNIMFGYLPLVSDARKLASVARSHDALLRQYERDSGRWIRRSYEFPVDISSTTTVQTNAAPALYGSGVGGLFQTGTRWVTKITETKTWFSGAFTYYLPPTGWRRSVAELDHLYGIRPGIDTVWELTGYSWLADYFTNIGDVAKNITAFKQDGLVMPYGYIMRKRKITHQETWSGPVRYGNVWKQEYISAEKTYTTHQRRLANPFGFGLELGNLSGRQLSILAALGISRM